MTPRGALLRRAGLACAGLAAALLACEGLVRAVDLDWRFLAESVYVNAANADVYEVSDDPALHYRLRPGASGGYRSDHGAYRVRVDAWGARGGDHPWEKPPGTFRILHLGASTVFGAEVDDDATLPARLERALASRAGRPVEVWNLGHGGFVQSQVARLAELELARVPGVDLLLLTITNATLRPFLERTPPAALRRLFREDPSAWRENFPAAPVPARLDGPRTSALYTLALRGSAAFRYVEARRTLAARQVADNPFGRQSCDRALLALEARAAEAGVPVVYANHPLRQGPPHPQARGRVVELARPGAPPGWAEIHPPPEVLAAWAEVLAETLLAGGIVPAGAPEAGP